MTVRVLASDPMPAPAFVHPLALIDAGAVVGEGTRVWAFAHLAAGAIVGKNCNICDHTYIEGNVQLGDRVTLKCGVYLWDGITVADDVFIGPCATFSNDRYPRSKKYPARYMKTILRTGASIGANATILPGITVGEWAMVGAAAVVTRDVPDFALVVGNPARFVSWICPCGQKLPRATHGLIPCSCGKQFRVGDDRRLSVVTT